MVYAMSNLLDNIWHQRFSDDEYFYGIAPNDFLVEASRYLTEHSEVLSLGEGEGRNAVFLAEQGHRLTALDIALSGLQKASKLAQARGVALKTVHADLSQYQFSANAWDAVINIFCHMHQSERAQFHQQIQDSLKPGGLLIFECYSTKQPQYRTGGPSHVDLLYSAEELARDFAAMDILHLAELEREVHEGQGHTGLSSVVQLIARKK